MNSGAPTLHFFCGKAGAGKSTLARQLADAHNATLISEDLWMWRLYGDQLHSFDDYLRLAPRLRSVVGPLTMDLLRAGQSVVLDFQANTRNTRTWFRSLFEQAGAAHVLHHLPTPDALCLQRIAQRNTHLPEGSHHLTEATFAHISSYFQPPQVDEGFVVRDHA
jgi:predicted kinase